MKLAITGESGFLGYHLTQYYKWIKKNEVIPLGRNYQDNIHIIKDCDFLIHCAGINRANTDKEIYEGNVGLAIELKHLLKTKEIYIPIKYISSIQDSSPSIYGKSKLKAKEILNEYCYENNLLFESYSLPNLFGPFGKPNYNSFVNTFCFNLINNLEINYNENSVNLCYVYDAIRVIDNIKNDYNTVAGTVCQIYHKLKNFNEKYKKGIIPELNCQFDINLFNTYRNFISPEFIFEKHEDDRGRLIELIKIENGPSQVFYSTTKPGVTRGNHFHFEKIERFCVLKGTAQITMRKIGGYSKFTYNIKGEDCKVIDMPILYTHSITNVGNDELVCVFWTNKIFDVNNSDTYYEPV